MAKHISEQYDHELGQIRELLMEMGGLVEQQVNNACNAFIQHDFALADKVRETESRLNAFEVELDDNCVSIIAKRQPTASDLRSVVSVMKVITDLERIGDEADRIAKMALGLASREIPQDHYADFRAIHVLAVKMLNRALDAFARLDVEAALRVIAEDSEVDAGYNTLVRKCLDQMKERSSEVEHWVNVIWAGRALERIGDHAKNISEYVIYQVKGQDVRHSADLEDSE